ncbi:phage tail protein [Paenibacillus sp. FJAT-26967]|uniref:phage tail protein n=1 Tax=Paenibacillus sp. FJAT-26967 TaxID=1729690 RepID=UPI00083924B8|nr:phage tail protein [Paenibacillus sp. FJAT-26967]
MTNKGISLQAKAQAGKPLKYTRFVLGDGQLAGQSIAALAKVISAKMTIEVSRLKMNPPKQAIIGFVLSNQDVANGFYFRELGLYALDPDEGEILYWYANAGETADYIPPANGSDVIAKNFDVSVFVGQAANVSAIINNSLVYATQDDLSDAELRIKQYTDQQIAGLDLTMTGQQILAELTKVDGAGSKLDADLLQGKDPSAFLEKATGGTVRGPIVMDTTGNNGKQLSVNMWGDLSASSGGQTVWGNNCYVDQGGKHRYSNTHATLGAAGIRINYGNIEFFNTGRIATTAGAEFTPDWKPLVAAGKVFADYLGGQLASKYVRNNYGYWPGNDANTCTTPGSYMFTNGSANTPNGDWCTVLVFGEGAMGRVVQMANVWNLGNDIFVRRYNNGWSQWTRIQTDENTPMTRVSNGKFEFWDGGGWKRVGANKKLLLPIPSGSVYLASNPNFVDVFNYQGNCRIRDLKLQITGGSTEKSTRINFYIDEQLMVDTFVVANNTVAFLNTVGDAFNYFRSENLELPVGFSFRIAIKYNVINATGARVTVDPLLEVDV